MSALFYRVLAEPAVAQDPTFAHSMLVASYLAGSAITLPLALLVAAAVPTAWRRRLLPRWTGWLGIVTVAMLSFASALTMLGPTNNHSAINAILLLAAVLSFSWLMAVSLTLTRAHRR